MLYIISQNYKNTWHIGEPVPSVENVTELQADGDELVTILNRFKNIPSASNSRIENWYGDMAKYIYKGLKNTESRHKS